MGFTWHTSTSRKFECFQEQYSTCISHVRSGQPVACWSSVRFHADTRLRSDLKRLNFVDIGIIIIFHNLFSFASWPAAKAIIFIIQYYIFIHSWTQLLKCLHLFWSISIHLNLHWSFVHVLIRHEAIVQCRNALSRIHYSISLTSSDNTFVSMAVGSETTVYTLNY